MNSLYRNDGNSVFTEMAEDVNLDVEPSRRKKLQRMAVDYYNAGTKALLGLLLTRNGQEVLPELRASINPTTRFNLGIDPQDWPEARGWNIR